MTESMKSGFFDNRRKMDAYLNELVIIIIVRSRKLMVANSDKMVEVERESSIGIRI